MPAMKVLLKSAAFVKIICRKIKTLNFLKPGSVLCFLKAV